VVNECYDKLLEISLNILLILNGKTYVFIAVDCFLR
jgi:hypothetical protein